MSSPEHHFLKTFSLALWRELRLPFFLLLFTFLGGSLGYRLLFPGENWTRLFFMTAITLSTVGYGDTLGVEQNPLAAWYTMLLLLAGMSMVVYALSSVTAFIVEGRLTHLLLENQIRRKIFSMKSHYIICGGGTLGVHVIQEMLAAGEKLVVIDSSLERLQWLKEQFPQLIALRGDATQEADLLEANLAGARGLVAALGNDKENLFLTLTARQINPELKIVSRAIDVHLHKRLKIAGADYIVSPDLIGGMRMASEILRPHVVSFLDQMLRGRDLTHRVSELTIAATGPAAGKQLGDFDIHARTGLNMLAWSDTGRPEDFSYNPGPETPLRVGGVLLFIANPTQIQALTQLLNG
jgi:voltage-gated potassium channel